MTWNNQPATTTQNQVTLAQSTSTHQDYLNIDVTALVNDMVHDPTNSHGFMFKLITEVQWRCMLFASSDHVDTARHPKLEVCYTIPTSIINLQGSEDVKVFSNQSLDLFTISWESSIKTYYKAEIFNMLGELLFINSIAPSAKSFLADLSNEKDGVYIVVLSGMEGQIITKLIAR